MNKVCDDVEGNKAGKRGEKRVVKKNREGQPSLIELSDGWLVC